MKRNIPTAYGLAGVFAFGAAAVAQEPAAVLLPVRAIEPASIVVRGATPYAPYGQIPQAPADSVPASRSGGISPVSANSQNTWVSRQWSGAADFVNGKGEAKPYAPFPSMDAKPQANPQANPKAPQQRPPQGRPPIQPASAVQMQAQVPATPQGVYAGPPAYRWYGWGSTTPGANPHSPTGVYPKASAAWYSQTGATPGAFPIPVTFPRRENTAEPPVYVGGPNPNAIEPTGRIVIAELPRSQPPAPVPYPEYSTATQAPALPQGTPMPIASNPAPTMPAQAPVASQVPAPPAWATEASVAKPASPASPAASTEAELNWTAGKTPAATPTLAPVPTPPASMTVAPPPMPAFTPAPAPTPPPVMPVLTPPPSVPAPAKEFVVPPTPAPEAPQAPIALPKAEPEQAWAKPKASPAHSGIVQASANIPVPLPTTYDSIAMEQAIRNACPKTVKKVEINRIGSNGLVIRFVVDAEIHAQEAATAIADLGEMKGLDVRYEALLLAK